MTDFSNIQSVLVPREVLDDGQQFMRIVGHRGNEGIVLWVGKQDGTTFQVTNLVIPEQRGIRTADGICAIIEGEELARLNMEFHKRQLQLITQVHSHPSAAYHSETDDEYAVATRIGSFSLVVPDFAVRTFSFEDAAIYRINSAGQWLEAPSSLFQITGEEH